jgi:hypothetical protein
MLGTQSTPIEMEAASAAASLLVGSFSQGPPTILSNDLGAGPLGQAGDSPTVRHRLGAVEGYGASGLWPVGLI